MAAEPGGPVAHPLFVGGLPLPIIKYKCRKNWKSGGKNVLAPPHFQNCSAAPESHTDTDSDP